jgi:uncharacterized damage-inducible protein DinB
LDELMSRCAVISSRRPTRSQAVTYSNFSGETFRLPLWQMMVHIVNHETHHRGELAAMYALWTWHTPKRDDPISHERAETILD